MDPSSEGQGWGECGVGGRVPGIRDAAFYIPRAEKAMSSKRVREPNVDHAMYRKGSSEPALAARIMNYGELCRMPRTRNASPPTMPLTLNLCFPSQVPDLIG